MSARANLTAANPRARLWAGHRSAVRLLLFIATFLLYLTTLTSVHTFDALSYVTSVERKPWTEVFHPHHLAYGPLGVVALRIGQLIGYTGGAALPMQLLNAFAGSLGVALFWGIARRATGRGDVALAATLLLGGAYAYWYYAVEIEVYTVATVFLLVCLDLLVRPGAWTKRRVLALAAAQAGAILFHQTNILLCAPIAIYALADLREALTPQPPLPLRWERGSGESEAPDRVLRQEKGSGESEAPDRALRWERGSGKSEAPDRALRWEKSSGESEAPDRALRQEKSSGESEILSLRPPMVLLAWLWRWGLYALALALAVIVPYAIVGAGISGFRSWAAFDNWLTEYARTGWWGGPITAQKWAGLGTGLSETLAQPGGALLWLLLVGLVVLHLRRLAAAPRVLLGALAAWLLVYGAFFLWWEPDNIEFWIASLAPALLLLGLALRGERRWGPGIWLALAVAATATGVNYGSIARRGDAATDLQRTIARALAARSQPADLLLVPDGLLELYLPYYEQRENFLSLNQALFDSSDSWERACSAVRARIDITLHAGASVLIADEVLRPPDLLLRRHHVEQAQVTACFAPYGAALQLVAFPPEIPAYWRVSVGQELAATRGWRFDHFAEGWQAAQVSGERIAQGWHFVPGSDPSLTSPLFTIDAGNYQAIEIELANGTTAHDAQLFFAGPDGAIGEERSVRWNLKPRSDFETYRVELTGQPGWRGPITRLRFDPVGVGDGGEMIVVSIRLIAK